MVTVFDPQGNRGEIPEANLAAFVKAGGMPGVSVKAPDGTPGHVPANRIQDAVKAGGQIQPFEDQDVKHPGFWSTLYDDAKGMVEGAPAAVANALPSSFPSANPSVQQAAQNLDREGAAGRSIPYKVAATAAQGVGANVAGMEKSADQGDMGGVMGHAAAVPAAMAVTEGAARGLPVAADLTTAGARAAGPVLKTAASKLPMDAVGASAGAAIGHATGIPGAGSTGAYFGAQIGSAVGDAFRAKLANALTKSPKEFALDATGENVDYAGEKPPKPAKELDATGENKPFAGGVDEPSLTKPSAGLPAQPVAAPAPQPGQAGSMAQSVAAPRTVVTDPATGHPEFSDVVAAKAQAKSATGANGATTSDPLLERLRTIASQIEQEEPAAAKLRRPGATKTARVPDPGEDLLGLLQQSLKQVQQKNAATQ